MPTAPAAYAAKELRAEEWGRLVDAPLGQALPTPLPPADGFVLIVEDAAGQLCATWAAYGVVHLEGCWIAEGSRKSPGVVRALVEGMFAALRRRGLAQVLTVTQSEEVGELARHLGGQPAGQLWVIPVPEEHP